jgi:hypothetical protein
LPHNLFFSTLRKANVFCLDDVWKYTDMITNHLAPDMIAFYWHV